MKIRTSASEARAPKPQLAPPEAAVPVPAESVKFRFSTWWDHSRKPRDEPSDGIV